MLERSLSSASDYRGMGNPMEVHLRAAIASVPSELGAHKALDQMFRVA